MKFVSANKIETNTVELKFQIAKDVFEAEVTKVFNQKKSKITVQGFRPGKAPRQIVEKIYGKGVFYEDAINDLIPDAYGEALKESALETVGQPEFDVVSLDDNGLVLSAKVYVKPEVEIKDYLGIAVEKEVSAVTDEEIEKALQLLPKF